MQGEKIPCCRAFVLEQVGIAPLSRDDKVEPAITVHVRKGNSPAEHGTCNTCFCCDVVETMIWTFDEKHSLVVAAHIVSGTERRPEARIADQAVIGSAQRLEFGPTIYFAFDKAYGLDDLKSTAVIKVSHAGVPSPAAAGNAETLAGLNVWSFATLNRVPITRAEPEEMAFLQRIIIGDVADKNVWDAITVEVGKIHAHAFERVATENARRRCGESAMSFQ